MTTDLNDQMEFDHVIQVHEDGTVTDAPSGIYAPEMIDDVVEGDEWTLMTGYTGQYGYNGPTMHPSECIGGRLAQDILATPGYYVAIISRGMDFMDDTAADVEDDGPQGWAIAFRPA